MKNSILTSDVLELFDRNHITANTLRKFVVESVADFLGDNKHDKVCGKLFDRWYQHVRRSIWIGAAQYVLQQHGFGHDEAINEAKQLYEDLYADYNKRYHCWIRNHCSTALARPRLYVLHAPPQADRKDREPVQLAPHVGQGLRGQSRRTRLLRLVSQPVGVASGVGYGSQDQRGTVRSQVGGRVDCGRWHGRVPPPLG